MKKLTALFLAVFMLLSMLPAAVFAEEEGDEALVEETNEEPSYEELVYEEPVYEEPVSQDPEIEGPEYEEPLIQEPVAEEPITEEPLNEGPAAEDPAYVEPFFVEPEPVTEVPEETAEEVVAAAPEEETLPEPLFLSLATPPALPEEDEAKEQDNFGGAKLGLSGSEIKDKILTDEDLEALEGGKRISVWLSAKEAEAPTGEAKEIADQKIKEEIPGKYDSLWLDISLMKQTDTDPAVFVQPKGGKTIAIEIDLSVEDIVKEQREYKVIHLHEVAVPGKDAPALKAEFVEPVEFEDGILSFSATEFSNYGFLGIGPWEVSYNMSGHGAQIASQIVSDGDAAGKPVDPSAEGYEFQGWYTDSSYTTEYDFTAPVHNDTVLFARWSVARVKVTFNMNGHGSQVPAQTLDYGQAAVKPAAPSADGYHFKGWYTKKDYKTAYDFSKPVKADTVLYAKWVRTSKVTAYVNDYVRGRISGESVRILEEGEEYTFHAKIITPGYYIGRVKVDGVVVSGLRGAGTEYASYTFTNKDASRDHTVEFVIYDSAGAPATGDEASPGIWALLGMASLSFAIASGRKAGKKKKLNQ